jgi:hypothetical protein
MDTCAICGRKRSPEAKPGRIRDGWACFVCVRRSATYLEVTDFGERTKRLASMTAERLGSSRDGEGMFVSSAYGIAVRLLDDKDVNQLTS